MGGENVAYHLRPNKYVERRLFVDLLQKVSAYRPISEYAYISMGGKFLEDFKLVHEILDIKNLISIEKDSVTIGRQHFNKPLHLIDCYHGSTSDFIKDFEVHQSNKFIKAENVIFWLDFANAKGRATQLRDFETLVGKLVPYDIVKVTMNCNAGTLYNSNLEEHENPDRNLAIEKLTKVLGQYIPPRHIDISEITDKGFANILIESIGRARLKGMMNKRGCVLHPLAYFKYSDGHHSMVTYCGIILPSQDIARFEQATALPNWPYYANKTTINEISVPDLSFKERMYVDERIFSVPLEKLHKKMPFKLDTTRELSLDSLRAYVEHYRRYPQFARVFI